MRRLLSLALAVALALAAAPAAFAAVGFRTLSIPDPQGGAIEAGVWYPAADEPGARSVTRFGEPLLIDAPVRAERLPLVDMSNGPGGG